MKKLLLVRVALLLVLVAGVAAALLGGRAAATDHARASKSGKKTEVVALSVAKRVPLQHARCRARAGF